MVKLQGALGLGLCLLTSLAQLVLSARGSRRARRKLQELQAALSHEQTKRDADRTGRIRAEQALKELRLQQAQQDALAAVGAGLSNGSGSNGDGGGANGGKKGSALATNAWPAYPFRPLGHMKSCFTQKNGTPRQPLLCPLARSRVVLAPHVPASCLEGLEQYSHCWVLYIFHCNTDMAKSFSGEQRIKGKIGVPRLNGAKMGVLATRSPHRPAPIGLSVAQIIRVEGNSVVLAGADIVDGSPVLDIKPYVPFCDSVPEAVAPQWVAAEARVEPLKMGAVTITPEAAQQLAQCWAATSASPHSLYASAEEFTALLEQVLTRDIRSLNQRRKVPLGMQDVNNNGRKAAMVACASASSKAAAQQVPSNNLYYVVLEHTEAWYSIDQGTGAVTVLGARRFDPALIAAEEAQAAAEGAAWGAWMEGEGAEAVGGCS